MTQRTLEFGKPFGGGVVSLTVEFDDSPLAEAIIEELTARDHQAMQLRWSGHGFFIGLPGEMRLPDEVERRVSTEHLKLGQVAFNVRLREICVPYGDVLFQDRIRPLPCVVFGSIPEEARNGLVELGNSIHRDGFRIVMLKPTAD